MVCCGNFVKNEDDMEELDIIILSSVWISHRKYKKNITKMTIARKCDYSGKWQLTENF